MFMDHITELGTNPGDGIVQIKLIQNTNPHANNSAFRATDVAINPRELFYTMGRDPLVDHAAISTMGFRMEKDWTFHIKERICQASRIDDLFVLVPGQRVPFRGRAMLIANGLLHENQTKVVKASKPGGLENP